MADDIVTRLSCVYADDGCGQCTFCLSKAEIEWLRAELAGVQHHFRKMEAALSDIEHLTSDSGVRHRIREARRG